MVQLSPAKIGNQEVFPGFFDFRRKKILRGSLVEYINGGSQIIPFGSFITIDRFNSVRLPSSPSEAILGIAVHDSLLQSPSILNWGSQGYNPKTKVTVFQDVCNFDGISPLVVETEDRINNGQVYIETEGDNAGKVTFTPSSSTIELDGCVYDTETNTLKKGVPAKTLSVIFTPSFLIIDENTSQTINVTLSHQPSDDVFLNFLSSDLTKLTVDSFLAISPQDFNTGGNITVTALNVSQDENVQINTISTSNDPDWNT